MKKSFLSIVLISTILTIVSCSNPLSWQSKTSWKNWVWRWAWRGWAWWIPSDIIRLKWRGWSWALRQWFGSWSRVWSWSIWDRFSALNEEDRTKLNTSMEARRSWDTTKADEIMKELSAKYPDVFSWWVLMWTRWWRWGWRNNFTWSWSGN